MVRISEVHFGYARTFSWVLKNRRINHKVPLKYQRYQDNLNPDEIVAYYSRDDIDQLNPRANARTFKDAQNSMSRKNYLLPNLSPENIAANTLFQDELDRQRAIIARINKIKVVVESTPGQGLELDMKKDISTPYDCTRHIHHLITSRTVVAELYPLDLDLENSKNQDSAPDNSSEKSVDTVDNNKDEQLKPKPKPILWDMHRPLMDSCRIKMRHFVEKDVGEVNKVYWRSCSFILGMAIRMSFKDNVKVLLHSWPRPDVSSGSFVYDAAISLSNRWAPDEPQLRAISKVLWSIKNASLPFERLDVSRETACAMFSSNPFKLAQIDSILDEKPSGTKLSVYRCGGLLDLSVGPMIANTSQIGRISLAAVHPLEGVSDQLKGIFYRFQGVSLPQQLPVSSYLFQNILLEHAKKLNKASL